MNGVKSKQLESFSKYIFEREGQIMEKAILISILVIVIIVILFTVSKLTSNSKNKKVVDYVIENVHVISGDGKEQFNKNTRNDISLPKELYEYDSTRINYVVIAGRRKDYSEKTYRLRREYQKNDNIYILHYDNLLDLIDSVNIDNKEARNY